MFIFISSENGIFEYDFTENDCRNSSLSRRRLLQDKRKLRSVIHSSRCELCSHSWSIADENCHSLEYDNSYCVTPKVVGSHDDSGMTTTITTIVVAVASIFAVILGMSTLLIYRYFKYRQLNSTMFAVLPDGKQSSNRRLSKREVQMKSDSQFSKQTQIIDTPKLNFFAQLLPMQTRAQRSSSWSSIVPKREVEDANKDTGPKKSLSKSNISSSLVTPFDSSENGDITAPLEKNVNAVLDDENVSREDLRPGTIDEHAEFNGSSLPVCSSPTRASKRWTFFGGSVSQVVDDNNNSPSAAFHKRPTKSLSFDDRSPRKVQPEGFGSPSNISENRVTPHSTLVVENI